MIKTLVSFLILSAAAICAQERPVDFDNVPQQISECLKGINDRYQISRRMNPFYVRADFDGDGRPDYAVLLAESTSKKEGFAVCFGNRRIKPQILGAGASVPVEGRTLADDFSSCNVWGVAVGCGARKHDCLFLEQAEAANGFFIWNGQRFVWKQGAI
jgi:hypothetical protein